MFSLFTRRERTGTARPRSARQKLGRACRVVVERMEGRVLLSVSINGSLAGPAEPSGSLSSGSYQFYINATGSSTVLPPTSETFHAGDGTNQTFTSPSNPQPVTQSYSSTASPTASIIGTTGGTVTVPLTLTSAFNASGSTVGYQVSDPVGATKTDDNRGYAMTTDSQGNIFVASIKNGTSSGGQAAVTEFSNSGAVVSSFGTLGTATIPIDSGKDTPSAIFYESASQQLLVAGNSSTNGWWVARLNSNGAIDNNFGSSGVETNFQTTGKCLSVTEETDGDHSGYVVLAGTTVSGTHTYAQLIRFNNLGALDSGPTGFGSAGKLTLFNSGSWTASSANFVMQADFTVGGETNKLLLMGGQASYVSGSCTATSFALAGISTVGGVDDGLDAHFGSSGETTVNFGTSAASCAIHGCSGSGAASTDADYSLVCWENTLGGPWSIYGVGSTSYAGGNQFALARFTQSGALDTSWAYAGVTTAGIGAASGGSVAYAAALQEVGGQNYNSADQIVCAGSGAPNGGTDFVVARFNLNGTLDGGFGPSGTTAGSIATDLSYPGTNSYNFTTGFDVALAVAWDGTNGTIDVAGWSGPNGNTGHIAVAEYIGNTVTISGLSPLASPSPLYAQAVSSTLATAQATDGGGDASGAEAWGGLDALDAVAHKRRPRAAPARTRA